MTGHARVVPARLAALRELSAFVGATCEAGGVGREDRLRLTLVVEELFTNTVVHGHGGDCDEPVTVTLHIEPAAVLVTYEDTAPAFDPTAPGDQPAAPADVEGRPVGGLGRFLIDQLATTVTHTYTGGKNRLTLRVPTGRR